MYKVIIKGDPEEADEAAGAHHLRLQSHIYHPGWNQTTALMLDDHSVESLKEWFEEAGVPPFKQGTLLYYAHIPS